MKITIQQYGSSIIALSIFALLIGLCMSMLEKNVLGLFVENAIAEQIQQESPSAFDIYRNQALPKIFSYGRYEIRTGTYTPISSCFYGIDREGNDIPVKVNQIWNEDGSKIATVSHNETECFYFENEWLKKIRKNFDLFAMNKFN